MTLSLLLSFLATTRNPFDSQWKHLNRFRNDTTRETGYAIVYLESDLLLHPDLETAPMLFLKK